MKFEKGDIVVLKSNLYTFITIVDDSLSVPFAEYKMIKCSYCIHNMNSTNYEWLDKNKEVFYKEVYEPLGHQIKLFKDALAKENEYYCEQTKTIKEMEKEFTKKDLKSGMWVELRNGDRMLCIGKAETKYYGYAICLIEDGCFTTMDGYFDNLENMTFEHLTIDKVFYSEINGGTFTFDGHPLIWQRNDKQDQIKSKINEIQKVIDGMQYDIKQKLESINKLKEELK